MKKTTAKKLSLSTTTIRSLQNVDLLGVAGGYNSNIWCPPPPSTVCQTPNCPV